MKHLFRAVCLLLCLALLPLVSPSPAKADVLYLIPDSNTRRLTEAELWDWDRESLSFIFNEIFARHGYVFSSGGKYDRWFRMMPWYTPNANADNQKYCLPKVTDLEWDNYHLIKKVAQDMDDFGIKGHDPKKKCYSKLTPPDTRWNLTDFSYMKLKAGQKLAVYSAPSASSWRGANGKASVSTNGAVYVAGWEHGWLLVYYETNNGSIRVGYVDGGKISGRIENLTQLTFSYQPASVASACILTDDPMKSNSQMTQLSAGTQVTYLTTVANQWGEWWDYIETRIGGKQARGYVLHGNLAQPEEQIPENGND